MRRATLQADDSSPFPTVCASIQQATRNNCEAMSCHDYTCQNCPLSHALFPPASCGTVRLSESSLVHSTIDTTFVGCKNRTNL